MLKTTSDELFAETSRICTCPTATTLMYLQYVSRPGGFLCVAKEITESNKAYVEKRWSTHCVSTGITNLLTQERMAQLMTIIRSAQPRLHQTSVGRDWARLALEMRMYPDKIKDQFIMVYSYSGMKACILMDTYLGTAPVVLAIPAVRQDAAQFKAAHTSVQIVEGVNFPYTRLFGRGQELNHSLFPDLYYCALKHYSDAGALCPLKSYHQDCNLQVGQIL